MKILNGGYFLVEFVIDPNKMNAYTNKLFFTSD
jgi:hypothetical protein